MKQLMMSYHEMSNKNLENLFFDKIRLLSSSILVKQSKKIYNIFNLDGGWGFQLVGQQNIFIGPHKKV